MFTNLQTIAPSAPPFRVQMDAEVGPTIPMEDVLLFVGAIGGKVVRDLSSLTDPGEAERFAAEYTLGVLSFIVEHTEEAIQVANEVLSPPTS